MKRNYRNGGEYLLVTTPDGVEFGIDATTYDYWQKADVFDIPEWLETNFPGLRVQVENHYSPDTTSPALFVQEVPKLPTLAEILGVIDSSDLREFNGMEYRRGSDKREDWGTDAQYSHWVPTVLEPGDSASFGDFKSIHGEPELSHYYIPGLLSGSDYGNSSALEVANKKAFLVDHGSETGMLIELYGDYESFGLAIQLDSITHDMLETFAGLEDYPVIDEQTLSEVEHEAENEAWESWAKSDFIRDSVKALAQEPRYEVESYCTIPWTGKERIGSGSYAETYAYFNAHNYYRILDHEAETITKKPGIIASGFRDSKTAHEWLETNLFEPNWTEEHLDVLTERINDSQWIEYFYQLADRSNTYWENEAGNSAYIDMDRIVRHVTIEDLERMAEENKSPAPDSPAPAPGSPLHDSSPASGETSPAPASDTPSGLAGGLAA